MALGPVRFARMAGSSIAAPDAAPWVTDFLNAAFLRRSRGVRDVADLQLAWGILTTRWHQLGGRRLHGVDVAPFVAAFGLRRFQPRRVGWGTLEPEWLLEGATRLIGDWFPGAWADDARRAYGIAFEDAAARRAHRPEDRLRHAALLALSPPREARHWHTYAPVPVPEGADAAAAALRQAERWPEWATPLARFTPLRTGATTPGQTFEIEVFAEPAPAVPVLTRAYVSVTRVFAAGRELDAEVEALGGHLDEPPVPPGGRAVALVELTTHDGHFLGRAQSRLVAYDHAGSGWVRDVGCWDPLPPHLAATYALAGRAAQGRLWGPEDDEASMLVQLAGWVTAQRALH
jgi:hypothetical protein